MQIVDKLISSGIPVFPCWDNKQPAIKKGLHAASLTPKNYWPSDLIGIPIPKGIVVIDIDTHKGMTTDKIDKALNSKLDWVTSLLQHTPSGGTHHAFSVDDPIKQGSDLFQSEIGKGFDTRCHTRGYVCAGGNYKDGDMFGILKLASPEMLPKLSAEALELLQVTAEKQHEPTPLPDGDRNSEEVRKMLKCLDADCSRSDWLNVALALKHQYHDNDDIGWLLFNNWSMTASNSYDSVEAKKLWDTVTPTPEDDRKPVTLGTIAHMAVKNGYVPSSIAASIFGTTGEPSASMSTVESLISKINADGGRPELLDSITAEIRNLECNSIQRTALTAALQRTLKDHGIKISDAELKAATAAPTINVGPAPQPVAPDAKLTDITVKPVMGMAGDHRFNAEMLRDSLFGNRLARHDDSMYWWTGSHWSRCAKSQLYAMVSTAFSSTGSGKSSNIDGTFKQLPNVLQRLPHLDSSSEVIFFKNGVFDPRKPKDGITPHKPDNFNTGMLSVDYAPNSPHPEWDRFLESIFHDEMERVTLLQEMMGWCLISGNLNVQKAMALDGASRGGKGTILDVIKNILGVSMCTISFGKLHEKQTLSSMARAQLAVDSDAKRPDKMSASDVHSHFNRITANEPVDIKINYQQETWNGRLGCKIMVACNGVPIMADDSSAAPRRWTVLKFTEDFTGREDLTLGKRLAKETDAIAAWAVQGLYRLMSRSQFTLPASSKAAIKELSESSSPLILFVEDCLTFGPDEQVRSNVLWDTYRAWCTNTNTRNYFTSYNFGRLLKQVIVERDGVYRNKLKSKDGSHGRGYDYVGLAQCDDGVIHMKDHLRNLSN